RAALATPQQLSPQDGASFDTNPRTTELSWAPVSGAVSYRVVVDLLYYGKREPWVTDLEPIDRYTHEVAAPPFSFQWLGAQPGRWGGKAVGGTGGESAGGSGWGFEYRRWAGVRRGSRALVLGGAFR